MPDRVHRTRADVYRDFGNPGRGKVNPQWEQAHMRLVTRLPGSWNGGKGNLYTHRLAEPYLWAAMKTSETDGVLDEVRSMGCFNFRHQRHDPKRPLSYHSWGIAIDINSHENAPRTLTRQQECFSPEWLEMWPDGVSLNLVSAWEASGWWWGGRWRPWADPMHFCLANG